MPPRLRLMLGNRGLSSPGDPDFIPLKERSELEKARWWAEHGSKKGRQTHALI